MNNFPDRFGFEPDLRKCSGKTIEAVELMLMEYGCTWDHAFAVRFTDGSRAFFAGHVGTGIMNPRLDGKVYSEQKTVEMSQIFTAEEYGVMAEAKKWHAIQQAQNHEREERHRYEQLKAKFETTPPPRSEPPQGDPR
jgi:hypothetical protein